MYTFFYVTCAKIWSCLFLYVLCVFTNNKRNCTIFDQNMAESQQSSSSSSPQMMSCEKSPKRKDLCEDNGTPLQDVKESESPDKESRVKTPVTINPFEVKADSLYFPSCSPSVFATFAGNKTNNGQFRWSIDHVSVLYPADIDETSVQDIWVDPDHEKEAQKAIDVFFSQSSIVPSPWSAETKDKREINVRRLSRKSSMFIHTTDVGVQTKVTIPPNIDLLALLGEEFLYNEESTSCFSSPPSNNNSFRDCDVMSTSSLRRKLFAADDGYQTPSRLERKDLYLAKQWSTPSNMRSMQSTPSDLLASSPITPPFCSEACAVRTSPQMSPITGPSSHKSIRMRSFNERLEEESNSQINKPSCSYTHVTHENSMSFCMDSQETRAFQSYVSEKQDTGYVTGSMFSLQNVTSDTTSSLQSRIAPVTEFLDDCVSNMSCNDSNMMCCTNESNMISCVSENNMSLDKENLKCKNVDSILVKSEKWSILPNSCSTPTFNL